MTKLQICIIHGGEAFESDDDARKSLENISLSYDRLLVSPSWKSWLAEELPDYDVLAPQMPSKFNAKYDEWALYFSKLLPFLRPDAVLIGHSLGGISLAKYFSELKDSLHFRKFILVAAPYNDESSESLNGFKLTDVSSLHSLFDEIRLLYSTDDPVVPLSEMDKYLRNLPDAIENIFHDKKHFNDPTFSEILSLI